MLRYSLVEILEATGGRLLIKGVDYFRGISIDSRTIKEGELFIALRGERFDGHTFVEEALKKAHGAIVSYPPVLPVRGKSIIHVDNTLKALQSIARYRRLKRSVNVIAVTGTNGKTTTKEMIATVLSRNHRVLRSKGNLNNHIGLPLCLAELNGQDMAVLEMGASAVGDIRQLCEIALPQIGVITNIGPAHLEGFGSIQQVRQTKLEMLEFVEKVVLNVDDPMLSPLLGSELLKGKEVITYGFSEKASVRAEDISYSASGVSFSLVSDGTRKRVSLRLFGRFNVYNALAAASVCRIFDCMNTFADTLKEFRGVPMRLELKTLKGATVISDLYNANPASMEEAIKELLSLKKTRAIAVLGDMLELGAYSEVAHRKLGRWIASLPVDIFVAVGPLMRLAYEEFREVNSNNRMVYSVEDPKEAKELLMDLLRENDTVLIKGSRGMRLEKILEE